MVRYGEVGKPGTPFTAPLVRTNKQEEKHKGWLPPNRGLVISIRWLLTILLIMVVLKKKKESNPIACNGGGGGRSKEEGTWKQPNCPLIGD